MSRREVTLGEPAVEAAVGDLFRVHYPRLVATAAVLLRDPAEAEDVVQDAFAGLYVAWPRLVDRDAAVGYLHRSVVNAARSRLRHVAVVARHRPRPAGPVASAEEAALPRIVPGPVADAVRALPRRQREVVLLRYYLDLSEAQTAEALGVAPGSVKSSASRGLAALRGVLESSEVAR